MIKKKYSLNQLNIQLSNTNSSFVRKKQIFSICPNCNNPTFMINNDYQIGYCTNSSCAVFTDLYAKKNKKTNNSELGLMPIIKEGVCHLDKDIMKKELLSYSLSKDICKQYNVGYYPPGYWVKPKEDWTFGKVIFPMTNWNEKLINICAKHIGSETKLKGLVTTSYAYNTDAVFNVRGIWNQEVFVFLDPIDCLIALENKIKNTIFINNLTSLPEIITFERVYVLVRENNFDKIENILDVFEKRKINVEIVHLNNLNIAEICKNICLKKELLQM